MDDRIKGFSLNTMSQSGRLLEVHSDLIMTLLENNQCHLIQEMAKHWISLAPVWLW